ncbi:pentatricopeptide repeat-containing protein, mitochondrial [Salvia divinorum]|uniref:Pentatricopeptide repeat-containing protein, mitochondrial n=1 Tax=Salvia divinorum TaxID=28513 RepID=A0ABD1IJ01_SALDI
MALHSKLRSLTFLHHARCFSTSILSPDSKTPLTSKEKSRAALSLLRFESNPERVLDICRAAALTPDTHLDRVAYSLAINKLKKSHYYEGIRSFVNDSLARPDLKSERSVSHFIVLYGQSGLVKDAIKLFDEIPQHGVEHNVKSLNALLMSCIMAGEYGEMKRIFSEFPAKYSVEPDLDTFNTVLKGFCESGSSNSAYSVLAEMERKGIQPNATTFSVVVAGFYKEEKLSDLEKVTEVMKKFGVKHGLGVYNAKIQSLCKLKKSDEAKKLLEELVDKKIKPNCMTYGHLIYGFCKEGKLEEAKALFKEMVDRKLKPGSESYFYLAQYLCKGKDFEAALDIYKECIAKGWVPRIATTESLVNGLISIGKVEEAKEIIGVMKEKFSRHADKWTEIEEGLAK